jgi:hypothetical protein
MSGFTGLGWEVMPAVRRVTRSGGAIERVEIGLGSGVPHLRSVSRRQVHFLNALLQLRLRPDDGVLRLHLRGVLGFRDRGLLVLFRILLEVERWGRIYAFRV